MDDLEIYLEERKGRDPEFKRIWEEGAVERAEKGEMIRKILEQNAECSLLEFD